MRFWLACPIENLHLKVYNICGQMIKSNKMFLKFYLHQLPTSANFNSAVSRSESEAHAVSYIVAVSLKCGTKQ